MNFSFLKCLSSTISQIYNNDDLGEKKEFEESKSKQGYDFSQTVLWASIDYEENRVLSTELWRVLEYFSKVHAHSVSYVHSQSNVCHIYWLMIIWFNWKTFLNPHFNESDDTYIDVLTTWLERGRPVKKNLIARSHQFVSEDR